MAAGAGPTAMCLACNFWQTVQHRPLSSLRGLGLSDGKISEELEELGTVCGENGRIPHTKEGMCTS